MQPWPWRGLYDPTTQTALCAPGSHVHAEELKDRIKRTITCSNFQMLADFFDFSGKGDRALGASRECKSGAINTVVGLTLVHTQWLTPCAFGFCREYLDVDVKFAHVNTVGTVTAVSVASADRALVTRHLRTLPDAFDDAGKSVNPSMLDVVGEIMVQETAAARTAAPTRAQPQRVSPAAGARLLAPSLSGEGVPPAAGSGGGWVGRS